MDTRRARLLRQLGQHRVGLAAPQDQPRALFAQARVERLEAVVQPPARRAAHRMIAGRLVVEHVDGDHRPVVAGGDQRGLIGEAEVLAEPEDHGSGHGGVRANAHAVP